MQLQETVALESNWTKTASIAVAGLSGCNRVPLAVHVFINRSEHSESQRVSFGLLQLPLLVLPTASPNPTGPFEVMRWWTRNTETNLQIELTRVFRVLDLVLHS